MSETFVTSYRATLGAVPLVPDGDGFEKLSRAFALEKAFYELSYELNHRPDWIQIPLAGILKLIAT